MHKHARISGFSKLSSEEKRRIMAGAALGNENRKIDFERFHFNDEKLQEQFEKFSENTLTNHSLPFGVIPNVLIDGKIYHVPAVIEESSVVAAASKAASFWFERGGFKTIDQQFIKNGSIYFKWKNDVQKLLEYEKQLADYLVDATKDLTQNMEKRGGGIKGVEVEVLENMSPDFIKLTVFFATADSMGANFINSILEKMAAVLPEFAKINHFKQPDVLMAILSNYTPQNTVTLELRTKTDRLTWDKSMPPDVFAGRMVEAVKIANIDVSRAVTHNKGIMNGSDAVIMATGNDYRAAEAAVHSWAAREGTYKPLSDAGIDNGEFWLRLTLPLAVGSVGGLTRLHPTASLALEMLGNPSAQILHKTIVAAGLANNFAAVAALVTSGIQKGHMKLHLDNILNAEQAGEKQKIAAKIWFADKTVSVTAVKEFLNQNPENNL